MICIKIIWAIKDLIDFKIVKRTSETFTNFDSSDDKIDDLYYYMQFIKFGFKGVQEIVQDLYKWTSFKKKSYRAC